MGRKDARIDAYIVNSPEFAQPILRHIRQLVHRACPEAQETMKWSRPHFEYQGMMCGISAFKAHCAIGFWRPEIRAMVDGPEIKSDAMGQFGRITALSDLPDDAVLMGYVKAAAALNESGKKAPPRKVKEKGPLVVPPYFQKALKADKKAGEVFRGFSPSKQREYVEWLTEAKTEATRDKRLATAIEWIAEGKSRNWKYMNC